jgi:hypothetical protein
MANPNNAPGFQALRLAAANQANRLRFRPLLPARIAMRPGALFNVFHQARNPGGAAPPQFPAPANYGNPPNVANLQVRPQVNPINPLQVAALAAGLAPAAPAVPIGAADPAAPVGAPPLPGDLLLAAALPAGVEAANVATPGVPAVDAAAAAAAAAGAAAAPPPPPLQAMPAAPAVMMAPANPLAARDGLVQARSGIGSSNGVINCGNK